MGFKGAEKTIKRIISPDGRDHKVELTTRITKTGEIIVSKIFIDDKKVE